MGRTIEELRAWLKRRLGAPEGFDVLWQQLEQDSYISEYHQGYIEDDEEVLRNARKRISRARELTQAFDGQTSTPRKPREGETESKLDERYFEADLSDYERERARAYEEVLAREAALSQGHDGSFPIANWRRRFFDERLLSLEEAHELLESPAVRFFQPGLFLEWGIPLLGHKAEVLEYDSGAGKPYIDHRATIKIDPPGVVKTVCYADQNKAGFEPETADWHWYLSWGSEGDDGIRPEERILRYKDRDGLKEQMWVWPGSVLDSLVSISSYWARALGWEEENMTMWLLTGEPFEWNPLKAKINYKVGCPLTVSLDIHPWIPADTVARNYRKIQHQLFGRDNRLPQPRSLAVLRFVEGRTTEARGERPSWSRLFDEWNEQCDPEWRYDNRSNLARAYREALRSVAHTPFFMPMQRVSPAAERKGAKISKEITESLTQKLSRLEEHGYRQLEG